MNKIISEKLMFKNNDYRIDQFYDNTNLIKSNEQL